MGWCTTFDLDRFAAAAGGYLRSRAAENTLLLSAAQAASGLRRPHWPARSPATRPGTAGRRVAGWLFGWWEPPDGGEPRGAFVHDPAAPLLISGLAPEMAAALAATLAKMGRPVLRRRRADRGGGRVRGRVEPAGGHRPSGCTGTAASTGWPAPPPAAGRGTRRIAAAGHARLPGAGAWPSPELPGPAGRLRVATAEDQSLLADWLTAFANETAERIGSPRDLAADLISYGGAVFWEAPQRPGRPRDAAHFLPGSRHRTPATGTPARPGSRAASRSRSRR